MTCFKIAHLCDAFKTYQQSPNLSWSIRINWRLGVVGPTPRFSFSRSRVGPENFDFCKFPGDADDVDIRTKL